MAPLCVLVMRGAKGVAMPEITTFLMFDGEAEEGMRFYISLCEQSETLSISKRGPDQDGVEGTVRHATLTLSRQEFRAIDSAVKHGFTFAPVVSLYVRYDTEEEIDRLFGRLSQGGDVLTPLAAYPFEEKFSWVADRYSVSWQLSLAWPISPRS